MNGLMQILVALLNSLWQAAIVAALVWLALKFLPRIKVNVNAATRYVIWWAALAVIIVLPGAPRLVETWRANTQTTPAAPSNSARSPRLTAPLTPEAPAIVTLTTERSPRWPLWVLALWASVFLFRTIQIARSYFYLRGIKRRAAISAQPLPQITRSAKLLLSTGISSPMAVGFLHPAVILPASLPAELEQSELEHVLLHEAAHIARNDDWTNLAARLLGALLALHPVAVWILRQIEREREMACDDWVVARTGEARPYAASLARMFELRRSRRGELPNLNLAAGIFGGGSRVAERIDTLLQRGRDFSPRASLARVVASTAALLTLAVAGAFAPQWIAFAQEPARVAFEVASIKPNQSGREDSIVNLPDTGRLSVTNATLKTLIRNAYGIQNSQIENGPAWLDINKYDIQAKTPGQITEDEEEPLLQNLIADRFHLKAHWESRDLPGYALKLGKNGRKFKENTGQNGSFRTSRGPGNVRITVTRVTMGQLAGMLGKQLGRVVHNKTGLHGYYDFGLEWDPEQTVDSSDPSIFAALQEQLGLKLEPWKGPTEVLVIDHVEKPDAN